MVEEDENKIRKQLHLMKETVFYLTEKGRQFGLSQSQMVDKLVRQQMKKENKNA